MAETPCAIVHIPHSSKEIPAEYRRQFLVPKRVLEQEKHLLTDAYTDEIFDVDKDLAGTILFPVSRLLVDPERMLEDSEEPMAKVGMGALYSRRADGGLLRREISPLERKELIFKYYIPHHRAVSEAVERALNSHGKALIIDCHSFPSTPLPCDTDQTTPRPDICVGTDPFHTPTLLLDRLVDEINIRNLTWKINRPYDGTFVPGTHYRKDSRVCSIMLEINRDLYMDECTGRKKRLFRGFIADIQEVVNKLINAVENLHERSILEGMAISLGNGESRVSAHNKATGGSADNACKEEEGKSNVESLLVSSARHGAARLPDDKYSISCIEEDHQALPALRNPGRDGGQMGGRPMRVCDFLPDAPAEWLDLPAEMELAFTLLPGHGVNQALFNEYTVNSMEAAVNHVFSRSGDCIFFHYRLLTRDVIPLFGWYVSRAVHSRGRQGGGFAPRDAVQGAAPWEFEADRTLMEIYCKPISGFHSIRMLRAGGRDRRDALARWHQWVPPIRRMAALTEGTHE